MAADTSIWTGALLSLSGVAVGAGLSELREWWKDRKTRRRVAIALTTEIVAMSDTVATCASFADLAEFGLPPVHQLNTHMLISQLPPEPAAYRALAGQLPLIDIDTVSAVIAFYGGLELARRLSTQHAAEKTVPDGHVPILGSAWRDVSRCALIAMQRIGKYNPPLKHQNDIAQLTELSAELHDILEYEWPRIEIDTATGKMRIGRESVRNKKKPPDAPKP
jgi:hypothetical protein